MILGGLISVSLLVIPQAYFSWRYQYFFMEGKIVRGKTAVWWGRLFFLVWIAVIAIITIAYFTIYILRM